MADKNRMPPQLLAHFKKKAEGGSESKETTSEERKEGDKERRKEALGKARAKIEEKNGARRGKDKEASAQRTKPA
jgi:hypothetical protein